MSKEENKAKVRRFFNEVCNEGNKDLISEIFARDVSFNGKPGTPDEVNVYLKEIESAFNNPHVEVIKQVAEEDWVSTMRTWEGMQRSEYHGHPSSGKKVTWCEISIVRFENGKIKEDWVTESKLSDIPELTDNQKDFLVKDYELKARYLSDHFQRMWTRFNFFITIESALVGSKLVFGDKGFTTDVASAGLIVSFIWYIIGAQDRHLVQVYRNEANESGQRANNEILKGKSYTSVGSKPKKAYVFVGLAEWYIEPFSITRLAAWIPFALMVVWSIAAYVLGSKH
jgi:predicted ester cyclase